MMPPNVSSAVRYSLALMLCSLASNKVRHVQGFTTSLQRLSTCSTNSWRCPMRMYHGETPNTRESRWLRRFKLEVPFFSPQRKKTTSNSTNTERNQAPKGDETNGKEPTTVDDIPARFLHGMPWNQSFDTAQAQSPPYYMPFWNHTMNFMKKNLKNLRALPVSSLETGNDLSYREGKNMRMHTLTCRSDEFRLIRLTVVDSPRIQVFTSVWYPDAQYNTPIMGIDLLKFGQRKHLCIVDMQPVHDTEQPSGSYDKVEPFAYSHLLEPIRDQYPSLQGRMTDKFYDENSFFSDQMLLFRQQGGGEEADQTVFQELFPAVKSYLQAYLDMHKSAEPRPEKIVSILRRHADYDVYSSERDPAHPMLAKAFGTDFADDYVYNVLFPLSSVKMF